MNGVSTAGCPPPLQLRGRGMTRRIPEIVRAGSVGRRHSIRFEQADCWEPNTSPDSEAASPCQWSAVFPAVENWIDQVARNTSAPWIGERCGAHGWALSGSALLASMLPSSSKHRFNISRDIPHFGEGTVSDAIVYGTSGSPRQKSGTVPLLRLCRASFLAALESRHTPLNARTEGVCRCHPVACSVSAGT